MHGATGISKSYVHIFGGTLQCSDLLAQGHSTTLQTATPSNPRMGKAELIWMCMSDWTCMLDSTRNKTYGYRQNFAAPDRSEKVSLQKRQHETYYSSNSRIIHKTIQATTIITEQSCQMCTLILQSSLQTIPHFSQPPKALICNSWAKGHTQTWEAIAR